MKRMYAAVSNLTAPEQQITEFRDTPAELVVELVREWISATAVTSFHASICAVANMRFDWSVAALAFTSSWLVFRFKPWRAVLWWLEQRTQVDINFDGVIGEPEKAAEKPIKPLLLSANGRQQVIEKPDNGGLTITLWREVATAVRAGAALSRAGLCGSSKLSQNEANTAIGILRDAGLAVGKGNGQELTAAGVAWLNTLLPRRENSVS